MIPGQTIVTHRILILCAILIAAALVRFVGLGSLPLWMDEVSSVWFSDQSYGYLWEVVPQFENHPSLYYMVLKTWRGIAGSSEFALRTPTVLAGLGAVVMIFVSGWTLGRALETKGGAAKAAGPNPGWAFGLTAAAVAAFSQFQINFSMEARPYAIADFGVAMMLAGMLQFICGGDGRGSGLRTPWAAVAVVVGMSITFWSHALGLVSAGLGGLFLIGWWLLVARTDRGAFLRLAMIGILVLVIALPHLRNMANQVARDYSDFWITAPDAHQLLRSTFFTISIPGLPGRMVVRIVLAALLLPMGIVGLWRMGGGRDGVRCASALACLLLLSAGFWIIVTAYTYLVQPIFLTRTLIFIQPPILLLIAAAPWALPGRWRGVGIAAIVLLHVWSAFGDRHIQIYTRDAREIVQIIAAEAPEGPVLALAGDSQLLLNYYEERLGVDLDVRPVPGPFPFMRDGLPDFIGRPIVDRTMADTVVAALGDAPVVWLMIRRSHFGDSGMALRESLYESGREETVIKGGQAFDQVTFLRFDLHRDSTQ